MLPGPPKNLEEQWSYNYCAHPRIEHSGFEPWTGTLRRVPEGDAILRVPISSDGRV